MSLGGFGLHGLVKRYVRRIDAFYTFKTCIEQRLTITNATSYQPGGYMVFLCSLQDAEGQFTHQRLTISRALARNDQRGIL